jgi:predicted O-methyltransferase YrrM
LIPSELVAAPIVPDLYTLAVGASAPVGIYAEFGVFRGLSLRAIRQRLRPDIRLYGFDSFEGLPGHWQEFPPGSFKTHHRVDLPNTELVVGWFEDTLPEFVRTHREHVSFLHIDCDLYSSTKTVLDAFAERILPGTVILFDELFGFAGYERHEWRALKESGLRYEVLGRWNAYRAALRVI